MITCPICEGEGFINDPCFAGAAICWKCNGKGEIPEEEAERMRE